MKTSEILKKYSAFRSNMGVPIDIRLLNKHWNLGKGIDKKDLYTGEINNPEIKRKIRIAEDSIDLLKVFNFVEFIGISGSVASGFADEGDDIDIFVVVKNDRAWIYRAVVLFRNIFHKKIRTGEFFLKDKVCVNFILEQRSLSLDPDIFNLNEIISLIPIFNHQYIQTIFANNEWLFDKYAVRRIEIDEEYNKKVLNRRYPLFIVLNFFFFVPQLVYMIISGHNPDFRRIWGNYKKGRIEFFPKDFKEEKLKNLET